MSNIDKTPMKINKAGTLLHCPKCESSFHHADANRCWNCSANLESKEDD